jgi:hypothetical protein
MSAESENKSRRLRCGSNWQCSLSGLDGVQCVWFYDRCAVPYFFLPKGLTTGNAVLVCFFLIVDYQRNRVVCFVNSLLSVLPYVDLIDQYKKVNAIYLLNAISDAAIGGQLHVNSNRLALKHADNNSEPWMK